MPPSEATSLGYHGHSDPSDLTQHAREERRGPVRTGCGHGMLRLFFFEAGFSAGAVAEEGEMGVEKIKVLQLLAGKAPRGSGRGDGVGKASAGCQVQDGEEELKYVFEESKFIFPTAGSHQNQR